MVAVFFLAAWYAMINMKIDALMLAYSGQHPGPIIRRSPDSMLSGAVSGNVLHIVTRPTRHIMLRKTGG